ncbi:putative ATP-grasp-modified RiPP [Streptomyces sp. NA04227]|uniref:putative ATP-grasp-modified RiPP n=1 Tax=Streptomyces sp. NA04227 TaxID=2742136 RepID=UPI001592924F|nr:putative ATP-grasp-modified RiPP [Streptomyces sp. NA04227]QKW08026.1 putative ATP-grasp-modified RiPP [Streptomyces sp. NA04227]
MITLAHPREAFPLAPEGGRIPHSSEPPSAPETRPWALRFARTPDATQATVKPAALYDEDLQMSVGLYDGPLPFMQTHSPTIPDGSITNPPPLDEGTKD